MVALLDRVVDRMVTGDGLSPEEARILQDERKRRNAEKSFTDEQLAKLVGEIKETSISFDIGDDTDDDDVGPNPPLNAIGEEFLFGNSFSDSTSVVPATPSEQRATVHSQVPTPSPPPTVDSALARVGDGLSSSFVRATPLVCMTSPASTTTTTLGDVVTTPVRAIGPTSRSITGPVDQISGFVPSSNFFDS